MYQKPDTWEMDTLVSWNASQPVRLYFEPFVVDALLSHSFAAALANVVSYTLQDLTVSWIYFD